jgi:hypothetical protein
MRKRDVRVGMLVDVKVGHYGGQLPYTWNKENNPGTVIEIMETTGSIRVQENGEGLIWYIKSRYLRPHKGDPA